MSVDNVTPSQEPIGDGRAYGLLWVLLTCAGLAQAAAVGTLAGALASGVGWGLLFATTLLIGYGQRRNRRPIHEQLGQAAALLGTMAFLFTLMSDGLIGALLVLLLWMAAAKNCTLTSQRDAWFALIIAFAALVFAASESKRGNFLVYVVVFSLAALYLIVLLQAEQRAREAHDRRGEGGRGALPASVLPLTGAVLALATGLYLVMPRPPAALLGSGIDRGGHDYRSAGWEQLAKRGEPFGPEGGGQGEGGQGGESAPARDGGGSETGAPPRMEYAGFSSRFDIGNPGQGQLDDRLLLYVQAPQPVYLKARSFDTFDGKVWSRSRTGERKLLLQRGQYRFADVPESVLTDQVVHVAAAMGGALVGAARVAELHFPGTVFAEDRYGALRVPVGLEPGTRYRVRSRIGQLAGRPLAAVSGVERAPYLQLPDELDPRVAELAGQVAGGTADPLQAATVIERHLRTAYRYTLATATGEGLALDTFLFETHEGHCELFATAMTLLLRSRGIPARVTTGFSASTLNPLTGYYEVTGLDAHAWVEVYAPGHGWVLFEPTPGYPLPATGAQADNAAEGIRDYVDRLAEKAGQTQPEATRTAWLRGLSAIFDTLRQLWSRLVDGLLAAGPRVWDLTAVPLAIAAVALVGLYFGYHAVRVPLHDRLALRRLASAERVPPRDQVMLVYRETERWFARRGRSRRPGETSDEYLGALEGLDPAYSAELATAFAIVRYGDGVPEPALVAGLRHRFAAAVALASGPTARDALLPR